MSCVLNCQSSRDQAPPGHRNLLTVGGRFKFIDIVYVSFSNEAVQRRSTRRKADEDRVRHLQTRPRKAEGVFDGSPCAGLRR